ncbi:MAG: histidinol-phosphatase HisJ family protein [Lachnospiraceae bacterium]|nr:histidinol-phosphatase HisJ family protein [Lachnospiraceae bacterium]
MIKTDSHLHSSFSSDSETPMEEIVKAAIHLGLTSICMTDHYDMDFPVTKEGVDFWLDTEPYLKEIKRLKNDYDGQIEILSGVELGIMPSLKDKLPAYLTKYDGCFDFIIGSTHVVDNLDPYEPPFYGQYKDERDGMHRYFEANLENLRTFSDIDTFGHLDYVVRYAPHKDTFYVPSDYFDLIDLFLMELIKTDTALEFNTAGLKYGMKQANPHIDILKRYKELGGELLTIGSDGHKPEHIAWDFKKGEELLKEAGFSYYTFYRKRHPDMIRL